MADTKYPDSAKWDYLHPEKQPGTNPEDNPKNYLPQIDMEKAFEYWENAPFLIFDITNKAGGNASDYGIPFDSGKITKLIRIISHMRDAHTSSIKGLFNEYSLNNYFIGNRNLTTKIPPTDPNDEEYPKNEK